MENPSNSNNSERKPSTGGGNFVWYLVAIGVGLMLMVTLLNSGSQREIAWSDLESLIVASKQVESDGQEADQHPGWIEVEEKQGDATYTYKLSMLRDLEVSDSQVTGKVTQELLRAIGPDAK